MLSYKYEVRDRSGGISTGVVQARSLEEASSLALSYGSYVLNVSPMTAAMGPADVLGKIRGLKVEFGPGLKDVMNFTNQLAVMIKAGINIRSAITGIAQQVVNAKFRSIIEQMKSDVESGRPFSEALARHPKVFSPLYINMVRASELSGNFSHMLERITNYLSQRLETRSMVRGAMVYPCIIAFMAVTTTIFLLTFVLPKFTVLFAGKEALLPKPTLFLITLSNIMRNFWYLIILVLASLVGGFMYAVKTEVGQEYWGRLKLKIPLFKRMLRALYITRGLQTMGELVSAGVPMLETLSITADVSGNILYKRMWRQVHDSVEQGNKIAQQLGESPLLPISVVQMISAGEESGNLGDVMRDIADFYAKELRATIKAVTAMIEPLMIMIMGVVVGFIAMSIILPIFKMSRLVK
jgi:type IV pilus assembly protein PilC